MNKRRPLRILLLPITLIDFVVSLPILLTFNSSTHQFQFVEKARWINAIGAEYFLGVDGISLLLVFLTTLLGAIAVICSFTAIQEREKEYYFSLLFLQTGMLGVFMTLDFFLFYVFWEDHACSDVLSDWDLGRATKALCGH